jgi:flagellar biosynthesis/type III secretory pathway chaperone
MATASRTQNSAVMEKKIEEFCQASAELLANIHERCSLKESGKTKKGKRGRKKKSESK